MCAAVVSSEQYSIRWWIVFVIGVFLCADARPADFHAVAVEAGEPTALVESAKRAGFTHVIVRLPYFRGASDRETIERLKEWSLACKAQGLSLIPQWPVCGPKELILSDLFFPTETVQTQTGLTESVKPSLLQDEYWEAAFFSKLKAIVSNPAIVFEDVCLDLTCSMRGESYTSDDIYEDGYLTTFRPFLGLQIERSDCLQRIAQGGFQTEYEGHVVAYTAERFRNRLAAAGDAVKALRFAIDAYRPNPIYEGIARGLAHEGVRTRCFLAGAEEFYGRPPELDRLLQDPNLAGQLSFMPRFDAARLLPQECTALIRELDRDFGGFLTVGFPFTAQSVNECPPMQRPKAPVDALESAFAEGTASIAAATEISPIQNLRSARQQDEIELRGPTERHPLFPGANRLTFDILAVRSERQHVTVEPTLIDPNWQSEQLPAIDVIFPESKRVQITLPVTVKTGGVYQILWLVRDANDGTSLLRQSIAVQALPVWEAVLDKSYYTREATARVRVRRFDGGSVKDMLLSASLAGGEKKRDGYLSLTSDPALGFILIDISDIEPGTYPVEVGSTQSLGGTNRIHLSLTKQAPGGFEIKLLGHRKHLLELNGEPQYVIGVFGMQSTELDPLGSLGVNVAVPVLAGPEDLEPMLENAERADVYFGVRPFDVDLFLMGETVALRDRLKQYQTHTIFYYNAEEPESGSCSPYALSRIFEFIKQNDPYRLQAVNLNADRGDFERFAPVYAWNADVLLVNSFPLPQGPMSRFDEALQHAAAVAGDRMPVWAVAQAFDWRVWDRKTFDVRTYTPGEREFRYMCYSAVVNGARGILFWSMDVLRRHPEMVVSLKRVLGEFSVLMPILVQDDALVRFSVEPCHGALNARAKWHQGKLYLFATNGDWFPQLGRFRFSDLQIESVTDWRSGRLLELATQTDADGRTSIGFQDEIEGAGVRLYIIDPK